MKEENPLRPWSDRARLDAPPKVDVTRGVMTSVRSLEDLRANPDRTLAWFAAFSASVAVPVATIALLFWSSWSDPLMELLVDLPWGAL